MSPLMSGEKMKTLVGVFREHQSAEQAGRLFRRHYFRAAGRGRPAGGLPVLAVFVRTILLKAVDLADWLQIHFSVGAVQIWKLARQSFAEQKSRDLAGLIDFRQGQTRQRNSGRGARDWNFRFDVGPTANEIAAELFIAARPLYLIEDKLVVVFNRFHHLPSLVISSSVL